MAYTTAILVEWARQGIKSDPLACLPPDSRLVVTDATTLFVSL